MKAPKVTVVVTVYNCSHYLMSALDSVAAQDFQDIELLVVDDGSRDRKAERICNFFASRCSVPTQYWYKENGGPASARNFGIEKASGEFVAFLDCDDRYRTGKLRSQVSLLESLGDDYAYVLGGVEKFDEKFVASVSIDRPDFVNGRFDVARFIEGKLLLRGTPGYLYRKKALIHVGGYDETLRNNEDLDLTLRLNQHFDLRTDERIVFEQRVHRGSLTKSNPIGGLYYSLLFADKNEKTLPDVVRPAIARQRQRAYLSAARGCYRQRRYREALWLIERARRTGATLGSRKGRLVCSFFSPFSCLGKMPEGLFGK